MWIFVDGLKDKGFEIGGLGFSEQIVCQDIGFYFVILLGVKDTFLAIQSHLLLLPDFEIEAAGIDFCGKESLTGSWPIIYLMNKLENQATMAEIEGEFFVPIEGLEGLSKFEGQLMFPFF